MTFKKKDQMTEDEYIDDDADACGGVTGLDSTFVEFIQ